MPQELRKTYQDGVVIATDRDAVIFDSRTNKRYRVIYDPSGREITRRPLVPPTERPAQFEGRPEGATYQGFDAVTRTELYDAGPSFGRFTPGPNPFFNAPEPGSEPTITAEVPISTSAMRSAQFRAAQDTLRKRLNQQGSESPPVIAKKGDPSTGQKPTALSRASAGAPGKNSVVTAAGKQVFAAEEKFKPRNSNLDKPLHLLAGPSRGPAPLPTFAMDNAQFRAKQNDLRKHLHENDPIQTVGRNWFTGKVGPIKFYPKPESPGLPVDDMLPGSAFTAPQRWAAQGIISDPSALSKAARAMALARAKAGVQTNNVPKSPYPNPSGLGSGAFNPPGSSPWDIRRNDPMVARIALMDRAPEMWDTAKKSALETVLPTAAGMLASGGMGGFVAPLFGRGAALVASGLAGMGASAATQAIQNKVLTDYKPREMAELRRRQAEMQQRDPFGFAIIQNSPSLLTGGFRNPFSRGGKPSVNPFREELQARAMGFGIGAGIDATGRAITGQQQDLGGSLMSGTIGLLSSAPGSLGDEMITNPSRIVGTQIATKSGPALRSAGKAGQRLVAAGIEGFLAPIREDARTGAVTLNAITPRFDSVAAGRVLRGNDPVEPSATMKSPGAVHVPAASENISRTPVMDNGSKPAGKLGKDRYIVSLADMFESDGVPRLVYPIIGDRTRVGSYIPIHPGAPIYITLNGGAGFGNLVQNYGRAAWATTKKRTAGKIANRAIATNGEGIGLVSVGSPEMAMSNAEYLNAYLQETQFAAEQGYLHRSNLNTALQTVEGYMKSRKGAKSFLPAHYHTMPLDLLFDEIRTALKGMTYEQRLAFTEQMGSGYYNKKLGTILNDDVLGGFIDYHDAVTGSVVAAIRLFPLKAADAATVGGLIHPSYPLLHPGTMLGDFPFWVKQTEFYPVALQGKTRTFRSLDGKRPIERPPVEVVKRALYGK